MRRSLTRLGVTVAWYALVMVSLRWWEVTLEVPSVALWSGVFAFAFAGTAMTYEGRGMLDNPRHPAWWRCGVWTGMILVGAVVVSLVPQIRLSGQGVATSVFVGLADAIVPLWIAASALAVVWSGWARAVALASLPPALMGALWFFVVRMPGESYRGTLPPLSAEERERHERLEADVTYLAVALGERSEETPDTVSSAAAYLERRLRDIGYHVVSDPFVYSERTYRNLIVELPGAERAGEVVLVGAHYDTAPRAPGADDNASGGVTRPSPAWPVRLQPFARFDRLDKKMFGPDPRWRLICTR